MESLLTILSHAAGKGALTTPALAQPCPQAAETSKLGDNPGEQVAQTPTPPLLETLQPPSRRWVSLTHTPGQEHPQI